MDGNEIDLDVLADKIAARLEARQADQWLTTHGAAEHLAVSEQLLEIARHRGEGPPFVRVNRAIRYSRRELDAWLRDSKRHHQKGRR
jgi:hypothetical protein